MNAAFTIIALLTVVAAGAAMALRNLVHCALCLVVTFAGLAALFLHLNAEFVGLVQIIVYVGAVAILIVFAILLTREGETPAGTPVAKSILPALVIAGLVLLCLRLAIFSSPSILRVSVEGPPRADIPPPIQQVDTRNAVAPVRQIGRKLMQEYVIPLEVMGLLLTAAMIGAVIIAMKERRQ
jgi:NADH-quinone oxidoreductase subunit J